MSQVPVELIVAAFQDEQGADRALKTLQQAKKQRLIGIQNAAVIRRDKNDKLHISETADWSGGKGAAVGAIVGGAIGLIFPPSVLAAGAVGAAVGGLGARLRDSGFPDQHLKEIGAALKPGTSAIVAVVEHTWVADLESELAAQGAKTVREAITADIAEQLEQGRNVAYTATSTGDTLSVSRATAGKDSAEMGNVTMTDEGITATHVQVEKDKPTDKPAVPPSTPGSDAGQGAAPS